MPGPKKKSVLFCTIVPLESSSGGTIVCREHLQRIAQTPNTAVHVFAPNSGAEISTGEFVQTLGATFHPLDLCVASANPAGPALQDDRLSRWEPSDRFVAILERLLRLVACDRFASTIDRWLGLGASAHFAFVLEKQAVQNWRVDWGFREIVRKVSPDVIVLDYLYTALFLPSAFHTGVPVSVVTLNRERDFYRQQRELGRLPADAVDTSFAEWRLGRFESEVYANADSLVVLSSNDIPADPAIAARTTVIEPVLEPYPQQWAWAGGRNLFFVGNIVHYPNFAAVRWLCEALAPALERSAPEARITIIGADTSQVPESWLRPNVDLLGRSTQEEVLRQFTSCGLFIAPIENNFGSKIKILECLAHATPMAATSEALTGLPSTKGVPLFSLEDPEGAARLVSGLLRSRPELEGLSARLQILLQDHLAASAAAWPTLIEHVAAQRASKRRFNAPSFLRQRFPGAKAPAIEIGSSDLFWVRSSGLGPLERYDGRPIRWTAAQAELCVAINPGNPPRWMDLNFWGITPDEGTEFKVLANEREVAGATIVHADWRRVVRLPRLTGQEELTIRLETPGFRIPGDDRILGLAIESVRLSRRRWSLLARPKPEAAAGGAGLPH